MIYIYEPICKDLSHEKVNSGFITGISEAHPNEKIVFFSHLSHQNAIKNILLHDNIELSNLDYKELKANQFDTLFSFICGTVHLVFFLLNSKRQGNDKVFFLSYNKFFLISLKIIHSFTSFNHFNFSLVLHGSFENITSSVVSNINLKYKYLPKPNRNHKNIIKNILSKCWRMSLFINDKTKQINFFKFLFNKFISEKDALLWRASKKFRFISLSSHIEKNAKSFIDLTKLNIQTITLPTNFSNSNIIASEQNKKLTFATFGYGNSLYLYNLAKEIQKHTDRSTLEIKIIGMDHRGSSEFKFITLPEETGTLDRKSMEQLAENVDFFLILYGNERYRLSCSGSILEALSYRKPILYFENQCIENFSSSENPIGIKCESIEKMAQMIIDLSLDIDGTKTQMSIFKNNIDKLRVKYSIQNNLQKFKEALSW